LLDCTGVELVETPPQAPVVPPPPKKRSKRVFVFAAIFILMLGGSAGAYWMYQRSHAPTPEATRTELVALEPFVANLSDGDGRFLRVTLRLVVEADESAPHVAEDTMALARVRSAILELLSEQTSTALVTSTGKGALKQAIAERANAALSHTRVTDVLFIEFVIQV
jgi:flagellar basal body-associated protein FliL